MGNSASSYYADQLWEDHTCKVKERKAMLRKKS